MKGEDIMKQFFKIFIKYLLIIGGMASVWRVIALLLHKFIKFLVDSTNSAFLSSAILITLFVFLISIFIAAIDLAIKNEKENEDDIEDEE